MNSRVASLLVSLLLTHGFALGQERPAAITPDAVKSVKRATVYLRVTGVAGQVGEGSGFFAVEPSVVVTNAHVLGMLAASAKPPAKIEVTIHSGQVEEKQTTAKLLGVDRSADLAVLRVDEKDLPPPLQLGLKDELFETQKVYIFGFPFGAQLGKNITVSESSISSLRSTSGGTLKSIQVNGGMHSGNSGGPVVDSLGRVVGVSVSVIKSTQINFAIPAASVEALLSGRIQEAKPGELFHDNNQIRVPLHYRTLDPFGRIAEVRVKVWAGKPAAKRPFSPAKEDPQPGDGPRQSHVLTYANGIASADIPLPKLEAGQVAWVQPVLVFKKGESAWDAPKAFDASLAVEREATELVFKLSDQKERTVHLKTSQSAELSDNKTKLVSSDSAELDILESFGPNPKGALVRTGFGAPILLFEDNGLKGTASPQVASIVQRIPPVFVVDDTNKLRTRTDINLNPQLPQVLREQVSQFYLQICNAYEATHFIMPNKKVEPHDAWNVNVPLLLKLRGKLEVVDLGLTCTYEGTRTRNDVREALVRLDGKVKSRNAAPTTVDSYAAGSFTVDLERGFISTAKMTISSDFSTPNGQAHALFAFNIDLKREAGNPRKIELPKETQAGALKAEVLVQMNGALGPQDPLDEKIVGSRAKFVSVPMTAGKTYSIQLSSNAFDCYLRLIDPTGKVVAEDDDSGGGLNSRIDHVARATGQYKIVVTSFDRKTGPFVLNVFGEKAFAVLLSVNETLGAKDEPDAKFGERGSRMKTFPIELTAGKSYAITMNSDVFDCYLRLLDPTGKIVAEDDDSGGGLNSRIDFVAKVSGQFKIVATSFDGGMGAFRLQVHGEKAVSEKDGPVKEKPVPEKAKEKADERGLEETDCAPAFLPRLPTILASRASTRAIASVRVYP